MIIVMLVFMFAVTYSYGLFATVRDYFRNVKGLDRCHKEYDRLKKKLDELEKETNGFEDWEDHEDLCNAFDMYDRKMEIVMDNMDMYYQGLHASRIEVIKAIGIVLAIVLIVLLMLEWRY